MTETIPYGFCHCGCGKKTQLAPWNRPELGWIKGEPKRFVHGHHGIRPFDSQYIVDGDTRCWLWQGRIALNGYGTLTRTKRPQYAHRFSYERSHGPIPEGLVIDHLCRNRACVNPDHLEPVTIAENCRRGAKAKLTHEQVHEIKSSAGSNTELARQFGVRPQTIGDIRLGRRWAGVRRTVVVA